MIVIPAVDIKEGRCVQLVEGEPGTGGEYGDPVRASLRWEEKGASCLHLIDLDAAMEEGGNLNKIAEILANVSMEVQVGGGIRNLERGFELLGIGANRVILGTVAFENPEIVRNFVEKAGSDSVMVAMDIKEGKVMVRGWKEELDRDAIEMAEKFEEMDVGSFLFTNVDIEGQMTGLDVESIREITRALEAPVIVAGGVKSLKDVKKAREAGATGLVIGTALYEGKISLEEAMEVAK